MRNLLEDKELVSSPPGAASRRRRPGRLRRPGLSCHHGTYDKRIRLLVLTTVLALAAPAAARGDAPAPTGLRFGEARIVTRPIYTHAEVADVGGPLRLLRGLMNGLHVDTRERVIRRELLFDPGDPYDPDLLDETARNLRSLGYLNDVRVVAADTAADGTVDVLVTARESWTLSTSFGYSRASGGDQRWNVKVAERNFLGYGVTVGAGVGADEDRSWWNAWYRKRRLFGEPLWFGLDWSETRDGHVRHVFLSRPLFALDDARGIDAAVWDTEAEPRWYLSHAGPAGADAAAEPSLYARLPRREKGAELQGVWRVSRHGGGRIWRLGGGARVTETTWRVPALVELSDDRVMSLPWLGAPGGPLAREQGVRVFPFAWLQSVGRRWTEARFVLQYGPVEDLALDATWDLKMGPTGGAVGSTAADGAGALRAETSLEKWTVFGRSHVLLRLRGEGQAGGAAVRTHAVEGTAAWIGQAGARDAPWITRVFAQAAHGSALAGDEALVLGLERGLRTLDYDGMAGDRLVRWNVEQGKVSPGEVLGLFRLGGAVFYDGGCAWWRDEPRDLGDARHEVGFGLRLGPTRSANTQVARIDVSWALDGSAGPALTAITSGLF